MFDKSISFRGRALNRTLALALILLFIWLFYILLRCNHSGGNKLFPGEKEARDMGSADLRTLTLGEEEAKVLLKETGLSSMKSRGATIFTDDKGMVRVPSNDILHQMEFRDLEELYHRCGKIYLHLGKRSGSGLIATFLAHLSTKCSRYLESIQVQCMNQVHLGSLFDGGYDLCNDKDVIPIKPCIGYSFGVRDDFSFDDELSKYYGCEIHSFDPANGMKDHKHSSSVYFHSLGLGKEDEITKDNWILKKFNSVMKDLHHTKRDVQIAKIDIESAEWPALEEMLASSALKGVKQLIMEFHSWVYLPPWIVNGRNKKDYIQHLNVLRGLYDQGFRIFYFKRFPANCCIYQDEFGITRDGCLEVHFMKVV